jgi:hypothetical protein
VALVSGMIVPEYIAFLMNSFLFRLLLNSKSSKTTILTIERLKSLELPYCNLEIQTACGRLEHLTAQLKMSDTALTREERLQLDLFTNLRDYLSLELFQSDFLKETGIEFLTPFVKMMDGIGGEDMQCARQIADELLNLGIKGFWNFSHYDLRLKNQNVVVENVHLGDSLMTLSYCVHDMLGNEVETAL